MPDTTLTLPWHKGLTDYKNKPEVVHVYMYIHTYNTNRTQLRTRLQIKEGREGGTGRNAENLDG